MTITRDIVLQERRCLACGRFYAVEAERKATCPYCAERRAEERCVEMAAMRRSLAALRGALTKAKARR